MYAELRMRQIAAKNFVRLGISLLNIDGVECDLQCSNTSQRGEIVTPRQHIKLTVINTMSDSFNNSIESVVLESTNGISARISIPKKHKKYSSGDNENLSSNSVNLKSASENFQSDRKSVV